MTRAWEGYIDRQWYCECQIVACLNIHHYLTGERIDPQSEEYEKMVDDYCARIGAAIGIDGLYTAFGMVVADNYNDKLLPLNDDGAVILPLEAHVWANYCGFHCVAVVEHDPITNRVRVPNFKIAGDDGWIDCDEFLGYLRNFGRSEPWYFRAWA